MKNKKILVTGGAGFIGCNLVRRLIKEGAQARVFDNFSTGKRDNLKDLMETSPPASVIARSEATKQSQAPVPPFSVSPMLRISVLVALCSLKLKVEI